MNAAARRQPEPQRFMMLVVALALGPSLVLLALGFMAGILLPIPLMIIAQQSLLVAFLAYLIVSNPYGTMSGTTPMERLKETIIRLRELKSLLPPISFHWRQR